MIMVVTNIWSGLMGLSVTIGDPDEVGTQISYRQREETSYRVEAGEPYITWTFETGAHVVRPPCQPGVPGGLPQDLIHREHSELYAQDAHGLVACDF